MRRMQNHEPPVPIWDRSAYREIDLSRIERESPVKSVPRVSDSATLTRHEQVSEICKDRQSTSSQSYLSSEHEHPEPVMVLKSSRSFGRQSIEFQPLGCSPCAVGLFGSMRATCAVWPHWKDRTQVHTSGAPEDKTTERWFGCFRYIRRCLWVIERHSDVVSFPSKAIQRSQRTLFRAESVSNPPAVSAVALLASFSHGCISRISVWDSCTHCLFDKGRRIITNER